MQDMGDLQTRKTKALKRGRDSNVGDKAEVKDPEHSEGPDIVQAKKPRLT